MSRELLGQIDLNINTLYEGTYMTNVKAINFNRITNEGFIGFHNNVATAAEAINFKDVRSQLDAYKVAIRNFSDYTTSVTEAAAKKNASKLDSKRTIAFRNFRGLVKINRSSLDPQRSALAKELWEYVKVYDNAGSIDQKSLTGVIESVIANIQNVLEKEGYAELIGGSDLEFAFNTLKETQGEFAEANQVRAEERRIREETNNKNLRNQCIAAFRQLINFVQYNGATKGDEGCDDFIDKVNVFIANSRSLYKARAKARAKANEDTPPTTEAIALPVEPTTGAANTVTTNGVSAEGRINAA